MSVLPLRPERPFTGSEDCPRLPQHTAGYKQEVTHCWGGGGGVAGRREEEVGLSSRLFPEKGKESRISPHLSDPPEQSW